MKKVYNCKIDAVAMRHLANRDPSAARPGHGMRQLKETPMYKITHEEPTEQDHTPKVGGLYYHPNDPGRLYLLAWRPEGTYGAHRVGDNSTHSGSHYTPDGAVRGLRPVRGRVVIERAEP